MHVAQQHAAGSEDDSRELRAESGRDFADADNR